MTELELVRKTVQILDAKKAINIQVLGIEELTSVADYFVIATGTSSTHIRALADEVEFQNKQAGVAPNHTAGFNSNYWIALDYVGVVVHIFCEEAREFYDLERLWKDGKQLDFNTFLEQKED